jgi:hypothetical protein
MSLHSLTRASSPRPARALCRAVAAALIGVARRHGGPEQAVTNLYRGDEATLLLVRAATQPAFVSDPQWAALAASPAVPDFLASLGPVSAAAALIGASVQLDPGRGSGGQPLPGMVPQAAAAGFVAEAAPIHVAAPVNSGATLRPGNKVAVIMTLSRETLLTTAAEALIEDQLRQLAILALDAAMLGTGAAVEGERPAGLRHGATVIAPTPGGGDEAMQRDLEQLAAAVAPVAGSQIVFVGSADLALKLALRRVELPYRVLTSAALPAGTIMAVAVNALVTAVDPVPEIETATEALLHMEDELPQHISTAGAPTAVAAPVRSLFQTDVVGLRLILGATWALRTPGAVATLSDATW